MEEKSEGGIDLDYVLLAGALAGTMTAIVTVTTLIARPFLIELGRQLPLPDVNEFVFGKTDEGE